MAGMDWKRHMSLLLAPEFQVPPPIKKREDLHPLPNGVDAYFVYPFQAEDLVLSRTSPLSSERVAAMQARHTAYLQARQDQREEDERDYIQRVAPGRGKGQPELQPTLSGPVPSEAAHAAEALPTADVTIGHKPSETHRQDTRDMEELQRLAAELRTGEEEKL